MIVMVDAGEERDVLVGTCTIDVHDTGWAVCDNCSTSWPYDRPYVYNYCPYCGRRIVR